jgi:hypothetical protein
MSGQYVTTIVATRPSPLAPPVTTAVTYRYADLADRRLAAMLANEDLAETG